jgi:hypothetical protein
MSSNENPKTNIRIINKTNFRYTLYDSDGNNYGKLCPNSNYIISIPYYNNINRNYRLYNKKYNITVTFSIDQYGLLSYINLAGSPNLVNTSQNVNVIINIPYGIGSSYKYYTRNDSNVPQSVLRYSNIIYPETKTMMLFNGLIQPSIII